MIKTSRRFLRRSIKKLYSFKYSSKYFLGLLLLVTIFSGVSYGGYALWDKVNAESLISQDEIILRVKKHIELPSIKPEEVVRVEDSNSLKKQNSFYQDIQEGNYIILYSNMAIIYDLQKDEIIAFRRSLEK